MLLNENPAGWREAYKKEVVLANLALGGAGINVGLSAVIMDIYCLPRDNHQTFYARLVSEGGFEKIICAKPVQNSVWFSEPIYNRTISEAAEFRSHPMKKGRIISHAVLVPKFMAERLINAVDILADNSDGEAVEADTENGFTAIRRYTGGNICKSVFFTNPDRLTFSENTPELDMKDYLSSLNLKIEEIIGIGENGTSALYRP